MRSNLLVGIGGAVAVALFATDTSASTLDFSGWTSYGASNTQGIWARNQLTAPAYDIYTRSFVYDGSLAGSGFNAGDVIVAIGASSVSGFTATSPLGGTGWKFQLGNPATPWSVGDVATNTNGVSSFSGLGASGAGSFTLQSNNSGNDLTKLTVMQSDGSRPNGILSGSVFSLRGDESMQIFLNTSTLSAASVALGLGAIPAFTPGSTYTTAFYPRDGVLQETLVNITVVPAPGAVALLGAAGLVGSRRRRN